MTRSSGTFTLLLHCHIKTVFIQCHTIFVKYFLSKFPWKAKCIIELESNFANKNRLICFLKIINVTIQKFHSLYKCCMKTIFFNTDDFFDIILFLYKYIKIRHTIINLNNCINCTHKKFACDAKHPTMTNRATQNTAQNIATSFVRRQNPIHNHDCHTACMIRNNLERNILRFIIPICYTGHLSCILDNWIKKICFEVRSLPLNNRCQTFKTTARINVFMSKRIVFTRFRTVILRKYEVPYFKKTITVTTNSTIRLTTAAFFTEVNVNFGIRTTRTRSNFPEIIIELNNM